MRILFLVLLAFAVPACTGSSVGENPGQSAAQEDTMSAHATAVRACRTAARAPASSEDDQTRDELACLSDANTAALPATTSAAQAAYHHEAAAMCTLLAASIDDTALRKHIDLTCATSQEGIFASVIDALVVFPESRPVPFEDTHFNLTFDCYRNLVSDANYNDTTMLACIQKSLRDDTARLAKSAQRGMTEAAILAKMNTFIASVVDVCAAITPGDDPSLLQCQAHLLYGIGLNESLGD